MRVGVIGAGAVGGYFGGRLAEKGADVTFLVRSQRRKQLEEQGLRIQDETGLTTIRPQWITAGEKVAPFDLILLSVKAYHLDEVLSTYRSYVGKNTVVLPLLNGIAHLDRIKTEWAQASVIGGFCYIESTLSKDGIIHRMSKHHQLIYGALPDSTIDTVEPLGRLFQNVSFSVRYSHEIVTDMWNKYMFISALSGMTTLMQTNIGSILQAPYGKELYLRLLHEIHSIASQQKLEKSPSSVEAIMNRVVNLSSTSNSSMYRDRLNGFPIETEHFHGTLVRLAEEKEIDVPILQLIYSTLTQYQPK